VALEELNSAYASLRREQVSWGESGAALGSLRSRYHDLRAKVRGENRQAASSQGHGVTGRRGELLSGTVGSN